MPVTVTGTLQRAAHLITHSGLHTGDQLASSTYGLSICAAIYLAAEGNVPPEFHTDEDASIRLIECSAPTMQAIRAVSESLPTEVCTTQITPDHAVPDYIDHVSYWVVAVPILGNRPPTEAEVIGRLLRTAHAIQPHDLAA